MVITKNNKLNFFITRLIDRVKKGQNFLVPFAMLPPLYNTINNSISQKVFTLHPLFPLKCIGNPLVYLGGFPYPHTPKPMGNENQ